MEFIFHVHANTYDVKDIGIEAKFRVVIWTITNFVDSSKLGNYVDFTEKTYTFKFCLQYLFELDPHKIGHPFMFDCVVNRITQIYLFYQFVNEVFLFILANLAIFNFSLSHIIYLLF